MEYHKTITLKDGRACTLRNGTAEDGQALLKIFNLTHTQTDYQAAFQERQRLLCPGWEFRSLAGQMQRNDGG